MVDTVECVGCGVWVSPQMCDMGMMRANSLLTDVDVDDDWIMTVTRNNDSSF